jgi:hypothetical protein
MAPPEHLGVTSNIYRMMTAETKPIPKSAVRRPGIRVEEATCRMTPGEKMVHPAMIVARRPIQSAAEPAIRAPKNVPAERIETMGDISHVL